MNKYVSLPSMLSRLSARSSNFQLEEAIRGTMSGRIMYALVLVTWFSLSLGNPLHNVDRPCQYNPTKNVMYFTDVKNCSVYYMCVAKHLAGTLSCPAHQAFDSSLRVCVKRENAADICNASSANQPCANNVNHKKYITSASNCSRYHVCVKTKFVATLNCGSRDLTFNDKINACVKRGSSYDICPTTTAFAPEVTTRDSSNPCYVTSYIGAYFVTHPYDCHKYHVCVSGASLATLTCGNLVFNDKVSACVLKGGLRDICSTSSKTTKPNTSPITEAATTPSPSTRPPHPCDNKSVGRFPHPSNCARFYDCALNSERFLHEDNLRECVFPRLYDVTSRTCRNYTRVTCGQRWEPKSGCDYIRNTCYRSAHCIPCYVRYGQCTNLPDGYQPWLGKERSPYYVLCRANRVVQQRICRTNAQGNYLIFDPVSLRCMEATA